MDLRRHGLLAISALLFAGALTQNGYTLAGGREPSQALFLLLMGWAGVFDGVVAWLGNPLLVIAWILLLLDQRRWALGVALAALAFMLSFLLVKDVMVNEAGDHARVLAPAPGYWLWLASGVVCALGAALHLSQRSGSATMVGERPKP